jgi:hypothetical protein
MDGGQTQVTSGYLGQKLQDEKLDSDDLMIDFNETFPNEGRTAALSAKLGKELKYSVDGLQGSIDTLNSATSYLD